MLFVAYPPCTTCQRAKKWLDDHSISYKERNIKEEPPTYEELKLWRERSGKPLKRFFNTSGMLYREFGLKELLEGMDEDEQLRMLSGNGMLVKRPVLVGENLVLVGFRESDWEALLDGTDGAAKA